MQEAGITANEKCVFSVDTIKFLGHIISQEGIRVDPAKVEAITSLPRPTNIQELRRLLGMVNHTGKFTPNLADTTKPLCHLFVRAFTLNPSRLSYPGNFINCTASKPETGVDDAFSV